MESLDTLKFTSETQNRFREASRDFNPLHASARYARTTAFGTPVVFGCLGVLALIRHLRVADGGLPACLEFEFPNPMYAEIEYQVEVDRGNRTALLKDGGLILVRLACTSPVAKPAAAQVGFADVPAGIRAEARRIDPDDLPNVPPIAGAWRPASAALDALLDRLGFGDVADGDAAKLAALLWSSYLVGMELPGERALYRKGTLTFADRIPSSRGSYLFRVDSAAIDGRFDLLRSTSTLATQEGEAVCAFAAEAFVRRDSPRIGIEDIGSTLAPSQRLAGKVALVTGASRGLGRAIALALCSQGGTVWANYLHDSAEADDLADEARKTPGTLHALRGDAGAAAWCAGARATLIGASGHLDALVCNAGPALRPMRDAPEFSARIREYVGRCEALVAAPVTAFRNDLVRSRGALVAISSQWVSDSSPNWPHYVAAKRSLEEFTGRMKGGAPSLRAIVVRPPRLDTDLSNSPLGRRTALHPAVVAARIVSTLIEPRTADAVELIESF